MTEKQQVRQLYENGLPFIQIAKETGLHIYKVRNIVFYHCPKKRSDLTKLTDDQKNRIVDLWRDGNSCGQIQNKTGIKETKVYYQLKKLCLVG